MRPDAVVEQLVGRPPEQGITLACLALVGGDVAFEWYGERPANDFQPEPEVVTADTPLISWSMAKSITHAAIGLLVSDGRLDLDAPAPVPEWDGTPAAAITPLQLLEMRSGLRFVEDYVDGGVSHCIEMLFAGTDPSHAAYAARLPLDHEPGSVFNYSSGTSNILARIVGDVASDGAADPVVRTERVAAFLRSRLFEPAGMSSATTRHDGAGDFVGSSYIDATARDFARFGELYAFDGVVDRGTGRRLLPAGWLEHARHPSAHDPESGFGYGRHWWSWPTFPGSLAAHGYEGQYLVVLPEEDMVLVHLGKTEVAHQRALTMTLARLLDSLR